MPRLGAPHPTNTTSACPALAPPAAVVVVVVVVAAVAILSLAMELQTIVLGKRRSATSFDDSMKAEAPFDERSATMACCNAIIDNLMMNEVSDG
jgi:Tfp pilus assembly protein PilX